DRSCGPRRSRRLDHRASDHTRARVARARAESRRRGKPATGRQAGDLRREAVGEHPRARREPVQVRRSGVSSPFRSWNGVDWHELFQGDNIKAIGGEQVLLCDVTYAPGFGVDTHAHPHTEQVMVVTEGELNLTVEDETRTLRAGDTAVIN